jgi:amidase
LLADQDMLDQNFMIDGRKTDPEYGWILTHHFNMLHNCPVMSVPSGRSASGVPTGIQLVGSTFDDLTVFRAATAYEHAVGGWFGPEWRPEL